MKVLELLGRVPVPATGSFVRSHFCGGFLDGLFGNAVGHQPAAELFDGALFGARSLTLGEVFAESNRDLGTDEGLMRTKTP